MVRSAKRSYTGMKHMASARKKSSSKNRSTSAKRLVAKARPRRALPAPTAAGKHFAVCVENNEYAASLELRKLYPVLDDPFAEQHGMIRVIDESGEDYLYPQRYFVRVELPVAIARTLAKIA